MGTSKAILKPSISRPGLPAPTSRKAPGRHTEVASNPSAEAVALINARRLMKILLTDHFQGSRVDVHSGLTGSIHGLVITLSGDLNKDRIGNGR